MLDADLEVEEEDKEIQSNLSLRHAREIIKIQASYRAQYEEGHGYQSLQTPALAPDDESALGKVYTRKGPIGRILMVRRDIQRERKRLNALLMAAHRYDKVLDRELATLAEEEEYRRSTKEVLRKQWEQIKEKESLVKIKWAAANAPLLNPRALSTSAPSALSTIKLTPSSTNPTSPAFMLIQKISDSDNES